MAGFAQTSAKYSVLVNGGNANVGYKAKMNFYHGQRRGYSTGLSPRTTTTRITDPGQSLKDIPWSVLSEVIMHLNNPSPLRNNWKAVAAELSLSFQTVQSLDHYAPGGMTEGVLQMMFQSKMTVQDFAKMMEKIQRPDIVEILVKAGLPENNIGQENNNGDGELNSLNSSCSSGNNVQDESKLSQNGTSQTTSITHIVNGCKQTYNCNQNKQSIREQKARQNEQTTREQDPKQKMQTTREQDPKQKMQTTREQDPKQKMQTTREQEAKYDKQAGRDSQDTLSEADTRKITDACEYGVPYADKSVDYQGQASKDIICKEIVGGSQLGLLNYGIPMERSVEESKEAVVGIDDSGGCSIVDRVVAFIVSAYSGSCGWLRFREN